MTKKAINKPKGAGAQNSKMLRVIISPRHFRLLETLKSSEVGQDFSETVRRSLDLYFDRLIDRKILIDSGPPVNIKDNNDE